EPRQYDAARDEPVALCAIQRGHESRIQEHQCERASAAWEKAPYDMVDQQHVEKIPREQTQREGDGRERREEESERRAVLEQVPVLLRMGRVQIALRHQVVKGGAKDVEVVALLRDAAYVRGDPGAT